MNQREFGKFMLLILILMFALQGCVGAVPQGVYQDWHDKERQQFQGQ